MGFDRNEPKQQRMLRQVLKAADINAAELWLKYFSIGGAVGEYEVEAYLQGLLSLPVTERDLLAMAANELIREAPLGHAPYSDEVDDGDSPPAGEQPHGSAEKSQQLRRGDQPDAD
jgi:hypothetical protein